MSVLEPARSPIDAADATAVLRMQVQARDELTVGLCFDKHHAPTILILS